ncbi:fungal Zn binuclear cluster domain-containing [Fusarium albosuccineum]|uniref:Fungal Zn binuclear cluster domain-containing n=1 Tax=Fusarium albosuccineum TaxID=1237068 RepID=A0A8H4P1R2_9HYPO|nr:fungal Zn binuclear cluster domain-containing [Fusarium albosuccineum]
MNHSTKKRTAMKRLGYRKSRTGCLRCKERRVKCDEQRPCSACIRHDVCCSLGGSPPDVGSSQTTKKPPAGRSSSTRRPRVVKRSPILADSGVDSSGSPGYHSSPGDGCVNPSLGSSTPGIEQEDECSHSHEDPFVFFSKLFSDIKLGERANWGTDMELMHHYTSNSYRTLSHDAVVQEVLQYDLPRLALQNRFLLHQILAFSGYHLAYLHQEHRHAYFMQASQHQNNAIEGLRESLASTVTSENCHALYAASILLTVSSFANFSSYDRYNHSFDPIDNILDIISLIKGMSIIRDVSDHEIKVGPLQRLFNQNQMSCEKPIVEESDLEVLYIHVEQLGNSLADFGFSDTDPSHDSYGIQQAITSIRTCIRQTTSKNSPTSTASLRGSFLWPILVANEYVELLRQRHPVALVVLAFYCMMLRMAEASCWALESWAESLMKRICSSLQGSHWEKLVEWPKQALMAAYSVSSTIT